MDNRPIGIFDSGVGGLTVLGDIVKELPNESIIYIGDSRNTPYGARSEEEIYLLSKKLVEFLLEKKVKLIVIACNTITVSCLDKLRSNYPDIPIIGTVPVVKMAASFSKTKRIAILSSTRTAKSAYQKKLIRTFASGCTVFNEGTDTLVPLVEKGRLEGKEITNALREVLVGIKKEHIDTLALGCTHFPFLRQQMQQILGPDIRLLDSGGAIARQVRRVITQNDVCVTKDEGTVAIFTTGNMQIVKKLAHMTIKGKHFSLHEANLED